MTVSHPDLRREQRKLLDEQIAAEAQLPPPDLPAESVQRPIEEHLRQTRKRPLTLMGIVENGLVRPLDPHVTLPERSRVIIVASDTV